MIRFEVKQRSVSAAFAFDTVIYNGVFLTSFAYKTIQLKGKIVTERL